MLLSYTALQQVTYGSNNNSTVPEAYCLDEEVERVERGFFFSEESRRKKMERSVVGGVWRRRRSP